MEHRIDYGSNVEGNARTGCNSWPGDRSHEGSKEGIAEERVGWSTAALYACVSPPTKEVIPHRNTAVSVRLCVNIVSEGKHVNISIRRLGRFWGGFDNKLCGGLHGDLCHKPTFDYSTTYI